MEKLTYINHLGETIEFGKDGFYVNANDLRDFEYQMESYNGKITRFSRGIVSKTVPVVVACASEEEGIAKKNRLFEIMEKDILAFDYGYFQIGEYKLRCYVHGSNKSNYNRSERFLATTLSITTDKPQWVREKTFVFGTEVGSKSDIKGLTYHRNYPYNYGLDVLTRNINNDAFSEVDFELTIHGYCLNPSVTIAGHVYRVFCEVGAGETLVINSDDQTVKLIGVYGDEEGMLHARDRESYIFEKIPSGSCDVTWDRSYPIDIKLIEKRSEPKWI